MKSVLCAAATLLAIIALITPASAEVIGNLTVPCCDPVVNPCNQEVVAITGEQHAVFRLTERGNGGVNLGINFNGHGTGIGSKGNNYVFNFTESGDISSSFPPPFTFTVANSALLVSQGNVPNFVVRRTLSFFFADIDADPVINTVGLTTACQPPQRP